MPLPVTSIPKRRQNAVYWAPDKVDAHGRPTFASPTAILCRWQGVNEQFIGPDGTENVSNAKVFPNAVLEVGGYLWLGELVDAPSDPLADRDAYEIKAWQDIPDFGAKKFLLIAMV